MAAGLPCRRLPRGLCGLRGAGRVSAGGRSGAGRGLIHFFFSQRPTLLRDPTAAPLKTLPADPVSVILSTCRICFSTTYEACKLMILNYGRMLFRCTRGWRRVCAPKLRGAAGEGTAAARGAPVGARAPGFLCSRRTFAMALAVSLGRLSACFFAGRGESC